MCKFNFFRKIQKFMRDIAEVYPGYKNGLKAEGLKMIELDISTVKSEEIEHLIPESKRPRLDPLDNDDVVFMDNIDDPDWDNGM